MVIFVIVNNNLKIAIGVGLGFAGYKLYKLYQLGESITYTPVGYDYSDGTIKIKMQLDNPVNTTLKMRGIDGKIALEDGTVLSTYSSDPFLIAEGTSYFVIDFKINALKVGIEILRILVSFNTPKLVMTLRKKIPLITISETFVIEPAKLR